MNNPSIQNQILESGQAGLAQIAGAQALDQLEQIRVSVLGKKGSLSEALKQLGQVDASERPKLGALANEWKTKIESAIEAKRETLQASHLETELGKTRIDVTLPSRKIHLGSLHPISKTIRKVSETLGRLGFDVTIGPEGVVLRSQTSPVQMRTMREQKWPVRILCPGAVYRCDSDATHSPMFHQIEGLWIDKNVAMSDLKGVLDFFAKELFGSHVKIRLRPSYFPFVEPGAEVDVSCALCAGKNPKCTMCKGSGWLEILGAGMVHPRLFELAGYDPKEISGFAFGMGVERIAMLLHDIPDLRLMFQGDQRFLKQF